MKKLLLRGVSGIIYVMLIAGSLILGPTYFCVLCIVFGVIGITEFTRLTTQDGEIKFTALAVDVFGMLCMCSIPLWQILPGGSSSASLLLGVLLFAVYLLLRFIVAIYDSSTTALRSMVMSVFAVAYLSAGLLSAQFLSLYSTALVLMLFIFIWINDTGAFLVGSTIGKHRLFERLSPKKSWEGFFGGLLLVLIVSLIFGLTGLTPRLLGVTFYLALGQTVLVWMLPVIVVIFATWGDLFESMIKRTVGAKDSGNLIPGHGGLLDRIDSMLFVMPASALFILISIFS